MRWIVRPSSFQATTVEVPGDKSISHRALMLAALADGRSLLKNLSPGDDVSSTAACLRKLGAEIVSENGHTAVTGKRLTVPESILDAGNSGTTMRLLSGILAGQPFTSTLTGDGSLRKRPMKRIAEPLESMGARVHTQSGHAPLRIEGGDLRGIVYDTAPPSAQVKSSILLAGLFASGSTIVKESIDTRDHTERMMRFAGISVETANHTIEIAGGTRPQPIDVDVPGDFSSAAFLLTAAALAGRSTVVNVGVNPTRTAFLDILERMACRIEVSHQIERTGEPVASLTAETTGLRGTEITPQQAPELLDELPLVALLAVVAAGETRVTGAAELRVKESDRIAAVVEELRKLGGDILELPDGFVTRDGTRGKGLKGAHCESHGDHRIAMMLALAGMVASGETVIDGVECASISYPGFAETLALHGVDIEQV